MPFGYILFRGAPDELGGESSLLDSLFKYVNVKAGEFELNFGDAHYRRSTNARVQHNPLIGNYVVDPRATEIGLELFNPKDTGPLRLVLGVSSGSDTGDFQKDHGIALHGKLSLDVFEHLRVSSSIYWVDHSGNPTGHPNTGSFSNMFRANRTGGPYSGVLDDGTAPGQVTPGSGQKLTAAQFDLSWDGKPLELYGNFGWVEDADLNGSDAGDPREAWLYYAAESVYYFTSRLYAAARYSGASALSLQSAADPTQDVNSDGAVNRIQVGGGYWLYPAVLAKLEYVYQKYSSFSADAVPVSGVDASCDPSFNGAIAEVSFAF